MNTFPATKDYRTANQTNRQTQNSVHNLANQGQTSSEKVALGIKSTRIVYSYLPSSTLELDRGSQMYRVWCGGRVPYYLLEILRYVIHLFIYVFKCVGFYAEPCHHLKNRFTRGVHHGSNNRVLHRLRTLISRAKKHLHDQEAGHKDQRRYLHELALGTLSSSSLTVGALSALLLAEAEALAEVEAHFFAG